MLQLLRRILCLHQPLMNLRRDDVPHLFHHEVCHFPFIYHLGGRPRRNTRNDDSGSSLPPSLPISLLAPLSSFTNLVDYSEEGLVSPVASQPRKVPAPALVAESAFVAPFSFVPASPKGSLTTLSSFPLLTSIQAFLHYLTHLLWLNLSPQQRKFVLLHVI